MKKKLAATLSVVLILGLATLGILAYLTDTDQDVNVMTLGNVDIEQEEVFERGDNLDPGVTVQKEVTVTNTGKSDAYVRTWFAFENPIDMISAEWYGPAATKVGTYEIDGTDYTVFVKDYGLVRAGKCVPSLMSVTMSAEATNDDVAKYGDTYEVLVFSQAIQVAGFENNEAAAWEAEFGAATVENNPWVNTEFVETAADLADALEAGKDVVLTDDVTVSKSMNVPAGKEVSFNLNGNDLSYAVSNSGASAIINNKGTLEITGTGTIAFVAENPDMQEIPTYATNTITNTGNLVIGEGVTVKNGSNGGASYAVDVQSGKFTLDGGTLVGERCALRIARFNNDTEFVMNSGKVEAATPAWIHLPGSNASDAPKISVTINGGTFVTTKASSADNNVLYTYSFGNSHANTDITINGGEFLGGTVSIGSGYYGDAPELTINGGTFDYDVLQWVADETYEAVYNANN